MIKYNFRFPSFTPAALGTNANAQIAVDAEQQIVVAASVTQSTNDNNQLMPVLNEAFENTAKTPRRVLADAGLYQGEGLRKHLYADDGRLRNFVNVYLNDEDIRYMQKEQTPVSAADTVSRANARDSARRSTRSGLDAMRVLAPARGFTGITTVHPDVPADALATLTSWPTTGPRAARTAAGVVLRGGGEGRCGLRTF